MLDLPRLARIRLKPRPKGQLFVANTFLAANYELFPKVDIQFKGVENLPAHPVILAMNHTDRYNYWPFQYGLWRKANRFTATWVKGKYFENFAVGGFLESMNSIPAASRGYLITKDYIAVTGKHPTNEQYEALRRWIDAVAEAKVFPDRPIVAPDPATLPDGLLTKPRDMLGRPFDPSKEDYPHAIDALFRKMTEYFVALNEEAFKVGNDVLIFPQGTRSVRLSKGRIGMAQIALRYKADIVPVGCSGSDHLYPAGSPWAKRGRVEYRIGKPIPYEEMAPFHINEGFEPFTPEAEAKHRAKFQGLTDLVMERINGLVDAPYQYSADRSSDGVEGSGRFV